MGNAPDNQSENEELLEPKEIEPIRVVLDPSSPSIRSIVRVTVVAMVFLFIGTRIESVIGSLTTSFDVWEVTDRATLLTIYGSEGTLHLPDPNTFGGPVTLVHQHDRKTEELPLTPGHTENSRGIGVSDMARAMRQVGIEIVKRSDTAKSFIAPPRGTRLRRRR